MINYCAYLPHQHQEDHSSIEYSLLLMHYCQCIYRHQGFRAYITNSACTVPMLTVAKATMYAAIEKAS
jgi:hypothetical protein